MNRYDKARFWLSDKAGLSAVEVASHGLKSILSGEPNIRFADEAEMRAAVDRGTFRLWIGKHRVLQIIATVDRDPQTGVVEEHVSVSSRHELMLATELPSWDELVAVRAIAWSDDVEVVQVLPAQSGPRAEWYVSLAEVLHLRRWRTS